MALYAAAVDTRIQVACVSGHFGPRERVWSEPIHRNVHGLLNHFGDAQLAALVAPRSLIIDPVPRPIVNIPGDGGAPGVLAGPSLPQVQSEWQNALKLLTPWRLDSKMQMSESKEENGSENGPSLPAVRMSLSAIGITDELHRPKAMGPRTWSVNYAASEELRRTGTLSKWNRFQLAILERSASERDQYWSKLDTKSA